MAKRKTKQQREDKAKAALLRRVIDFYHGACPGGGWEPWLGGEDTGVAFAYAETIARVVAAVRHAFNLDSDDFRVSACIINEYDNPWKLTEFLFSCDVRAEGVKDAS